MVANDAASPAGCSPSVGAASGSAVSPVAGAAASVASAVSAASAAGSSPMCQSPFNDVRATVPPDDLVFRRVAQKSVLQRCPESVTPVGQRHTSLVWSPRPGNTPPQTASHPSPPTGLRRAPSDRWDRPLVSPPSPRARHRDGPLAGLLRLKLRPGARRHAHRGARGRPRRRPCRAGAARRGRRPARGRR